MEITRETARYVAKLARLEIAESEMDDVCQGLSSILSYMDEINASVDVSAAASGGADAEAENASADGIRGPTRADTVTAPMDREALLSNAPERGDETPIVPRIVE